MPQGCSQQTLAHRDHCKRAFEPSALFASFFYPSSFGLLNTKLMSVRSTLIGSKIQPEGEEKMKKIVSGY